MFQRFMFGGPVLPSSFETTYRCYSASMFSGQDKVRKEAETGGKIIMPQSALESLVQLHIQYPMIFKLTNPKNKKNSHAGVIEFTAEEGRVYVPYWIMQNLLLCEGDMLSIENVSLPKATYAKFQPQNVNFLDISNPKAVLENELRKFACLSTGDIIVLHYNNKEYELLVQQLKPADSVTIIECDVNVEFDKPVGYEESTVPKSSSQASSLGVTDMDDLSHQPVIPHHARHADRPVPFPGAGQRLDGKAKAAKVTTDGPGTSASSFAPVSGGSSASAGASSGHVSVDSTVAAAATNGAQQPQQHARGVPNYDYRPGELHFIRQLNKSAVDAATVDSQLGAFRPFDGAGMRLKTARSNKGR